MPVAFHQRLREGFHAIAAAEPSRCVLVDATAPVAVVQRRIREAVAERLGLALP